jgi:purine nucleoside phosphorylase
MAVTRPEADAMIKTESMRRDCADQPKRNSEDRQRRQAIYTAIDGVQFELPGEIRQS